MKKILIFIACLAVLVSCKKTSYIANFDKLPQERAADQIAMVSNTLTSATNGWVATLPTQQGGGYSFYLNFDKDNNVTMLADLTDESATTVGKSYYRIKQDIGTDLVFDSYCYLAMLNDPKAAVLGGQDKIGYKSDVDFIYDRTVGDSIVFIGKKYRQSFKLVKATTAQKAAYDASAFKPAIDKFKNFFATTDYPYIEVVSGTSTLKVGVTVNATNNLNSGKRVEFTGVVADGITVKSSGSKFAFNLDGISLLDKGATFEGVNFVKFAWKNPTTLAVYDSTGKEYIVKSSLTPLIPLYMLWGAKYTGMLSQYLTIYPGTSTNGAALLNYYHTNITKRPPMSFAFNYGRMNFKWNTVNKRLEFIGHTSQSNGTSTWETKAIYSYTIDGSGEYTFTRYQAAAGGYATAIMDRMETFLLNNKVKFDYHIDGVTVYGKMFSTTDPSIAMTFILQ